MPKNFKPAKEGSLRNTLWKMAMGQKQKAVADVKEKKRKKTAKDKLREAL